MSPRLSLGRSLVVAGILTAVAVPVAGGVAFAGTSSDPNPNPTPMATATHAPAHSHHAASKSRTLMTRMAGVHIRSKASIGKKSKVLVTLHKSGSKVMVSCYKTGANVSGDTTWYRTVSPKGFVAGHELAVATEPAAGVTACKIKK